MINSSLTDYIQLVEPYTPSTLISPTYWLKIKAVADFLPRNITSFFGFECPLGIAEPQSDFLICTDAEASERKILASENGELLPELISAPIWQQINQFSKEWQSQVSILHEKVNNIWLEFDINDYQGDLPLPSCFFGAESLYSRKSPHGNIADNDSYEWITRNAFPLLVNANLPESVEATFCNCLDLLPPEAYVFQIGLMLARNIKNQVRVCIRNISPVEITAYLQQIGWTGAPDILQGFLTELSGLVDRIDLDIDVGESVAPKIGLECYLLQQPKLEPKWQLFLNYLVDRNLCLSSKQAALLDYPGFIREKNYQGIWPSYLAKDLQENNSESVFFRRIHHIKIVYQNDQPQLAKAYLAMEYFLITSDFVQHFRELNNSSV
ncbi:hypothetical protein SR1949_30880 [Sphaerospermopsis reniformis]|uniref:Uncharacterized protein n=1 Tax=Sphaerospermopsis reniformis TaxID=531300 RepID=A0A479ZZ69_9CYAN|nr:hypothetical protein [Sphaerospermopsis reniformis]GCL37975.1 hypothetical protein SR1949_30880 [Sphaerospermopsis reniformis]